MKFKICVIGKCKSSHILALIKDYTKRLPKGMLEIVEIKPSTSSTEDGLNLLNHSSGTYRILLDERGEHYTSKIFSKHLYGVATNYNPKISFLIGGAYGHSDNIKSEVRDHLSLSSMTLPHMLARLILVEQLYRVNTIIRGHPYNK